MSVFGSPSTFFVKIWDETLMWVGLFLIFFIHGSSSLKLTKLEVTSHPVVGHNVLLRCLYDMESDEIYSIKWYKSGSEFYRYHPKDRPPVQTYNVSGIQVDLNRSDRNTVTLLEVNLTTSGVYRCEVSAEAPAFTTVHDEREMVVIDLPEEGPKITGGRTQYRVGDTVHVNCTSLRSKPAAMLSWTINGGLPHKGHLREFPMIKDDDGLETSILGLEFLIHEHHFNKDGQMKLRCTAIIAPVYHQSNEESVIGGGGGGSATVSDTVTEDTDADGQSRQGTSLQSKASLNLVPRGCPSNPFLLMTSLLITIKLLTFLQR